MQTALPTKLAPSLIDRLTDASLDNGPSSYGYSLDQLIAAVGRDLEELLNTRQTSAGLCDDLPEAQRSLLTYGLPDPAGIELLTPLGQHTFLRSIEKLIEQFEPRVQHVRLVLTQPPNLQRRSIQFRIEARLRVEPTPRVLFDAALESTTGRFRVNGSA
ncbi:type VI secretion system baseplate subunit TssE [Lignipirellula cremea]|uniref:Gene 25-like lysozyme n=1 Tax=Lignipirellula cremea TaxID=2528010 RepID=A0A518DT29_9BACT|nr:type VI secretion system baseplate subunit TssE [Lignipirellula cremea]QDU95005.1 Gene 25-like lysozyme [Lignipirellula cremea]